MKIKALIFDLDGVIVDTAKYHYLAWKELADELGFFFSKTDNEKLKGVSRMRSLDILLEVGKVELEYDVKLQLAAKKNERYVGMVKKMPADEILPGVLSVLKAAKEKGYKIALGSASKNAMTILNQINISDLFDAIIDGNKVSNAKPDPEVFLMGANELNVKPQNCVVFEDAAAGVEAAHNGKMFCIGIGTKENLAEADIVIPSFENFTINDFEKIISR
ncbi:MAG: beta-phosphoglucomutase [Bacteroidetes bacterium 4572_117]|nr:MAG: beta-phosphoglucomutase [Bacteroidetes bacterium 4572_117]